MIGRGDALRGLGRFEEALDEYQFALQLDPRNSQARIRVNMRVSYRLIGIDRKLI